MINLYSISSPHVGNERETISVRLSDEAAQRMKDAGYRLALIDPVTPDFDVSRVLREIEANVARRISVAHSMNELRLKLMFEGKPIEVQLKVVSVTEIST